MIYSEALNGCVWFNQEEASKKKPKKEKKERTGQVRIMDALDMTFWWFGDVASVQSGKRSSICCTYYDYVVVIDDKLLVRTRKKEICFFLWYLFPSSSKI